MTAVTRGDLAIRGTPRHGNPVGHLNGPEARVAARVGDIYRGLRITVGPRDYAAALGAGDGVAVAALDAGRPRAVRGPAVAYQRVVRDPRVVAGLVLYARAPVRGYVVVRDIRAGVQEVEPDSDVVVVVHIVVIHGGVHGIEQLAAAGAAASELASSRPLRIGVLTEPVPAYLVVHDADVDDAAAVESALRVLR